jgi:hypothetical protein
VTPEDSAEEERVERNRSGSWLILLASFLPIFFITCLFMAMRGVLDLGGFVARGGPYVIEHEAPGYVWIFPVAIIGLLLCIVFLFATIGLRGEVDVLIPLVWPLLFLSLGWNFLEYAFFRFDHLMWGWLICGILFLAMGLTPLVLVFKEYSPSSALKKCRAHPAPVILQLCGITAGIFAGYFFFRLIS